MESNYAVINETLIVNTAVAEYNYAQSQGWVALPEGFGIGDFYIDGQFVKAPIPSPTPEEIQAQNKAQATSSLAATDWVELPDVSNIALTPHLINKAEFTEYRSALRAIAVNPPTSCVDPWPVKPVEQWST